MVDDEIIRGRSCFMFVEASWGVDPMDIHDIQHEWNKNHEENKLICHGLCGGYYSTRSIISLL